jgi:hypothetical protein
MGLLWRKDRNILDFADVVGLVSDMKLKTPAAMTVPGFERDYRIILADS